MDAQPVEKDKYLHYPVSNDFTNQLYDDAYQKSQEDKEAFWTEQAEELVWFKKFETVIDESDEYLKRWFPDGESNICYNAVDRHCDEGRGELIALQSDSVYTGKKEKFTYNDVQKHVGKLASILKEKFSIERGDRVIIYMPMVPVAAWAMLACARIGAIHSVVFGGFAAKELANRIDDCQPKLIITCSCGIEPRKSIKYVPIVNEALTHCEKLENALELPILIYNRNEKPEYVEKNLNEFYTDYDKVLKEKDWEIAECEHLPTNHELYILYTSGTTGTPKGIVRAQGDTAVGLNYCMKNVFDLHEGGVHFACSDIGWVVGHSFIVYGPLIRCATTIFFEGKPIVPDAGVIWRVCQEYKVTSLYMAPTAVRVIKKDDYDGKLVKKYNTDSVRTFCLVGERCDPDTIFWINRHFPKVLINDTWWQTETGWPISANILNLKDFKSVFPTLPGSVTRPIPGYDVQIFNEETNEPVENPGDLGKVVIKLPLPPAFMLTLWGNDEAFIEKYLAETPGYYTTGDAGIIDDKGYIHIMTRTDDVINTAGHRISTGRLEEVVNDYGPVVESAVIGFNHPIRGEVPVALVIMKNGIDLGDASKAKYAKEINAKVRADVGAFCRLEGVLFADRLPKTRSGKILRRTIREICNQQEFKMPATIDDETSIDHIKDLSSGWYKTIDLSQ